MYSYLYTLSLVWEATESKQSGGSILEGPSKSVSIARSHFKLGNHLINLWHDKIGCRVLGALHE